MGRITVTHECVSRGTELLGDRGGRSRVTRRKTFSVLGAGFTALALLAGAPSARAENCGSVSAGWNVPAGGGVYTAGPGPFYAAFSALGEYDSHSMLSRGPDSWVTQATSDTPPLASPLSCSAPINGAFLQHATPGLEWIGQGAAYNEIYGNGAYAVGYHPGTSSWNGPNAPSLLNNDWGNGPGLGWWQMSSAGSANSSFGGEIYITGYNNAPITYGWYQLKNIQGTAQGVPGNNNGVVCSSSLALWQHDTLSPSGDNSLSGQFFTNANGQQQAWNYSGDVAPRRYGSTIVGQTASAMWNAIYNECYSQAEGMFSAFGSTLSQAAGDVGIFGYCFGAQSYYGWGLGRLCTNAANQMLNTFAADGYSDSSSNWQSTAQTANVNGAAAVSISPDDIFGYHSNGTGAPTNGNGASIWGADPQYTVQFNTGGADYSCWD